MLRRASIKTALLATTICSATGVAAQVAAPATQEQVDATEIVVTAQKIEQRAIDVPITISALTGERISELGVSDLDELSNYVPGLNVQEQSANNPGLVIRGITSDSGSAQQGPRAPSITTASISRARAAAIRRSTTSSGSR